VKRIDSGLLENLVKQILTRAGVSKNESAIIAESLVHAELSGCPSHGISKLCDYLKRLDENLIEKTTTITTVRDTFTTAVLDANNGWGQVASQRAVDLAIEKARNYGSAWISVRNSNHNGRCGYWASKIANAGMVGIAMTNTSPVMVAYGSSESTLGTNPIAISVPSSSGNTISLDMSTSHQARGKITLAHKKGESIPKGWAVDAQGLPTTDPSDALAGSLLPMGGHKGSGLAIMIDILSGVMSGSLFGSYIPRFYDDALPQQIGHLFVAMDISTMMPLDEFTDRISQKENETRNSKPAPGREQVYMPGDLEQKKYMENRKAGVPIPEEILLELKHLAAKNQVAHLYKELID
jgi:LDH2 family malate/lactate/ureidoglycolate dehydrogenase